MTIYFLGAHNKPSGGTKVLNQMVNLCLEKNYQSRLVISEPKPYQASFLNKPAPVIVLEKFRKICQREDIVINCWPEKRSHQIVKNSPVKIKIFWQHGASIPVYSDFNGEEVFASNVYHQHWNVSKICAKYIQKKYNIKKIGIVQPFFDDDSLLKHLKRVGINKREGVLFIRRRGQEILPHIVKRFPHQKITILPRTFTDDQFYKELIKHKFFVSTDNGVRNKTLIPTFKRNSIGKLFDFMFSCKEFVKNRLKRDRKLDSFKNKWIVPKKNLLGFPMTACEAAWLGAVVIGFAMGGGREWMNKDNMYLAQDGNADSLLKKIEEAVNDSESNLKKKRKKAFKAVYKFNKERTWKQITNLLKI